jgi:hypothetical protein
MYHYTKASFQVQPGMMFFMASIHTTILACITLTLCPCTSSCLCIVLGKLRNNVSMSILSNPIAEYPVYFVLLAMAPVVRIEPNGVQTLLLFDNAQEDLERNGWRVFVEKFEGFNLAVAQQFVLTFDGCRAKIGDVQLKLNEYFISSATGLPAVGQKWFKNSKVDEVP